MQFIQFNSVQSGKIKIITELSFIQTCCYGVLPSPLLSSPSSSSVFSSLPTEDHLLAILPWEITLFSGYLITAINIFSNGVQCVYHTSVIKKINIVVVVIIIIIAIIRNKSFPDFTITLVPHVTYTICSL